MQLKLVGLSNVGKSSIIKRLLGNSSVLNISCSSKLNTTINDETYHNFIDTPGMDRFHYIDMKNNDDVTYFYVIDASRRINRLVLGHLHGLSSNNINYHINGSGDHLQTQNDVFYI